jgi:hypothetical protein
MILPEFDSGVFKNIAALQNLLAVFLITLKIILRSQLYIFAILVFFIAACHKKNKSPEEATAVLPVVTNDTGLKCQNLPPTPVPFGWQDSTTDGNKNINSFLFDPINPNGIIYVVNGDAFGLNKLFIYNIISKQANQVGMLSTFLPQVNRKGWIVYSDVNNNIILLKGNRDSSIVLTSNKHNYDPKWDFTGNYIYYYEEAHENINAQLVKIDTAGINKNAFQVDLPYTATFKTSDKIIYIQTNNSTCKLILRDLTPPATETVLISGPTYSKPGQINFDNMTLDNTDQNFYWSNSNGIFRCNLTTLKTDTLLKNCPNIIYNNPIISFTNSELTYSQHIIKPISTYKLLHKYRAMDMNLLTGISTEIKIFP